MQVIFEVPWKPPSVNHYWEVTMYRDRLGYPHRGRKLSKEAIAWKQAVAVFARGLSVAEESKRKRKNTRYRIEIDVFYGPKDRGDADNLNKGCLDALQDCGVICSDARVETCKITVHRDERDDPRNPRTQFMVERLEK